LAGAVTWWVLTRPASLALTAEPRDARIRLTGPRSDAGTFGGSADATGALSLDELEPGRYRARIERPGFEPASLTLDLQRGRTLVRTVALPPQPFEMSFATRPPGAAVRVTRAGGEPVTGTSPCRLTVYAGDLDVTITKNGYNAFSQAVFLEGARDFDVLLDPKGQLVHALGSIATKGAPKVVALTPDGREAWPAILIGRPSIQIFDPMTARITGSIDLGEAGAVEVVFNKAGTRAYASQMETKLHETSKVFELDVQARRVLRTFDTRSTMTKVIVLSPDEKTLYAANWAGNDVSSTSPPARSASGSPWRTPRAACGPPPTASTCTWQASARANCSA
jgi:hypothetical protein